MAALLAAAVYLAVPLKVTFSQDGPHERRSPSPQASPDDLTFSPLSIFDGFLVDDNGAPIKVKDKNNKELLITTHGHAFHASNGETARVFGADLHSTAFAREYLEKRLKTAEIIHRGPRNQNKPSHAGERIVALISSPVQLEKGGQSTAHKTTALVIYINGASYVEISADTLAVALALEAYLDGLSSTPTRR
jgi:hypothetical protein